MTTLVPLVARLLLIVVFVPAAISKATSWDANASYMASRGIPLVPIALALSLAIEAAGSMCLVLGWRAREAAAVMAVYLVPVTLYCHDFFGTQFNKNLGIIGGLMMIAAYGPGRWALSPRVIS
jgi:putative oxidoreductase